jgi:hypothetical protein
LSNSFCHDLFLLTTSFYVFDSKALIASSAYLQLFTFHFTIAWHRMHG